MTALALVGVLVMGGTAVALRLRPDRTSAVPAPLSWTAPPEGVIGVFPFGPFHSLPEGDYAGVFTGAVLDGYPDSIVDTLQSARAAGVRVALALVGTSKRWYKNADGTFNIDLWKAQTDRYADIDLEEFIADGTILVNYLIDEPKSQSNWGGETIPDEVLDELARYSKESWPNLPTAVREEPVKLGAGGYAWRYLDAAWAQYSARKGPVGEYVADQAASARLQGLGLVVGMNVLSGGNGAFDLSYPGIDGTAMSPAELRSYGSWLMAEPYVCALMMWRSDDEGRVYFGRPDVEEAMSALSDLAAHRSGAPCDPH